jgi:hypothetical protein
MTAEELEMAAAFLEDYALRPPRAEPHHPAVDSPRWREIQNRLRDLAARIRRAGRNDPGVEFLDTDAQFLETQSARLFRMHHWILRGPPTPESRMMAESAKATAERLPRIGAMIRSRRVRRA